MQSVSSLGARNAGRSGLRRKLDFAPSRHCRDLARIHQLVANQSGWTPVLIDLAPNSRMGACSKTSGAMAGQSASAMSFRAIGIVCTAFPSGGGALHRRRRDSSPLLRTASFAALLSFATALGLSRWEDAHPVSVIGDKAQAPTRDEVAVAFAESSDRLLDPTPLSEPDAPKFAPAVSGGSNFWLAFIPPAARVETRGLADQARARPVASPTPNTIEIAASPPLPMPRPAELSGPEAPGVVPHGGPSFVSPSQDGGSATGPNGRTRILLRQAVRRPIEQPTPGTVLAYAAPEAVPRELAPGK